MCTASNASGILHAVLTGSKESPSDSPLKIAKKWRPPLQGGKNKPIDISLNRPPQVIVSIAAPTLAKRRFGIAEVSVGKAMGKETEGADGEMQVYAQVANLEEGRERAHVPGLALDQLAASQQKPLKGKNGSRTDRLRLESGGLASGSKGSVFSSGNMGAGKLPSWLRCLNSHGDVKCVRGQPRGTEECVLWQPTGRH